MKKFNINDYFYIQITEAGWRHLEKTVGDEYIKYCINGEHSMKKINGEIWYRLQCRSVFNLLPNDFGKLLFKTTIMLDDEALEELKQ